VYQWGETVELTKEERTGLGASVSWQRGPAVATGSSARMARSGQGALGCAGTWRVGVTGLGRDASVAGAQGLRVQLLGAAGSGESVGSVRVTRGRVRGSGGVARVHDSRQGEGREERRESRVGGSGWEEDGNWLGLGQQGHGFMGQMGRWG
jgi:hypothetical protein